MANSFIMKDVRAQSQMLSETFDHETFVRMLEVRGLSDVTAYVDPYTQDGWIVPIDKDNKPRYHRGHMLILMRLRECNHIDYFNG